jgi:hypothetical protein
MSQSRLFGCHYTVTDVKDLTHNESEEVLVKFCACNLTVWNPERSHYEKSSWDN